MRQYYDISHFRAPYKNAMFAGFGQEPAATSKTAVPGFQWTDDVTPTPAFTPAETEVLSKQVETKDDGKYAAYKSDSRSEIWKLLGGYYTITSGDFDALMPMTDVQHKAVAAGQMTTAADRADFLLEQGLWVGISPSILTMPPGKAIFLKGFDPKDATALASTAFLPIFAEEKRGFLAGIGVGAIALIALATGGVLYWANKGSRRRRG